MIESIELNFVFTLRAIIDMNFNDFFYSLFEHITRILVHNISFFSGGSDP